MAQTTDRTILVVDDDPNLRRVTTKLLEHCGYRVVTAADGVEALGALADVKRIDLVILDVMMPKMDGYELLARLKQSGFSDLHVVMLTAKQEDGDIIKGYGLGADYYVTKPFKAETLVNIANYLIGDLSPAERAELETRL